MPATNSLGRDFVLHNNSDRSTRRYRERSGVSIPTTLSLWQEIGDLIICPSRYTLCMKDHFCSIGLATSLAEHSISMSRLWLWDSHSEMAVRTDQLPLMGCWGIFMQADIGGNKSARKVVNIILILGDILGCTLICGAEIGDRKGSH